MTTHKHRQRQSATTSDRPPITVDMVAELAASRLTTPQIITLIDRLDQILIDRDRERQPADLLIAEHPIPPD